MTIEYKSYGFNPEVEFKDEDDDFAIMTAVLSPFDGKPDQGGDIVMPKAFNRTLKRNGNVVPMLWQHKSDEPIGINELKITKEGLIIKSGKIDKRDPIGARAVRAIKLGSVRGVSIGFQTIKHDFNDDGFRELHEIKLMEGSVVTFPMNEGAMITGIKQDLYENVTFAQTLGACKRFAAMENAGFDMDSDLKSQVEEVVKRLQALLTGGDPVSLQSAEPAIIAATQDELNYIFNKL